MNKFAVIGAGKVGGAVALLLKEKGWEAVAVSSLNPASAGKLASWLGCPVAGPVEAAGAAEIVFITTPDREIRNVADTIAAGGGFRPGQVVLHMSGGLTSDELSSARNDGALALSVHPLQSCASIEMAMKNLPGTYYAVEGDEGALEFARGLVRDLDGKILTLRKEDKPLYHAAACIACNYLTGLLQASTVVLEKLGLNQKESIEALFPLLEGTLKNNLALGPVEALTGPIARGDVNTVAGHLARLPVVGPEVEHLYRVMGLYTINVGMAKGTLSKENARALENLLRGE